VKADADQPLEALLLTQRAKRAQILSRDCRFGLDLDRGVSAEQKVDLETGG
jgi:hypothetical protein